MGCLALAWWWPRSSRGGGGRSHGDGARHDASLGEDVAPCRAAVPGVACRVACGVRCACRGCEGCEGCEGGGGSSGCGSDGRLWGRNDAMAVVAIILVAITPCHLPWPCVLYPGPVLTIPATHVSTFYALG